jgi:hypothetical protein
VLLIGNLQVHMQLIDAGYPFAKRMTLTPQQLIVTLLAVDGSRFTPLETAKEGAGRKNDK